MGQLDRDFPKMLDDDLPEALYQWRQAIASGDVDTIVSLYSRQARLKGTIWNNFVGQECDRERAIRDYFLAFTNGRSDFDVEFTNVEEVGENIYAVDYTFSWQDHTGKRSSLPANATFVVKPDAGSSEGARILLHHSSAFFAQD